tara:strand:- start:373 stop:642 length:270 start_codon:yes stop_codon:yes gene_type:complete
MEKQYKKHGVDDNTISINKVDMKEEEWHDDYKGTLVLDGKQYYVNMKIKSDSWMVGTFKEKPPRVEQERTQPMQSQQAVDPDLDDEIPF